jgi:ankyrin repeat protein
MKFAGIHATVFLMALPICLVQSVYAIADSKLDAELLSWCGYGNFEKADELLKKGANPNASNEYGHTPLKYAAREGKIRLINLLIKAGANINAKDKSGNTALNAAAGSNRSKAVKALLDAGAKPEPDDLSQACIQGDIETVTLLLSAGISPDEGLTSSAQNRNLDVVRLLLSKGAAVNKKDQNGITALHVAALQGGPEIVQLLLDKGADPNVTNDKNETPLHKAISGDGNLEVVKLLVQSGAKLTAADAEGVTPVRLAAIRGSKQIYSYLLAQAGGKEPTPAHVDPKRPSRSLSPIFNRIPATNSWQPSESSHRAAER